MLPRLDPVVYLRGRYYKKRTIFDIFMVSVSALDFFMSMIVDKKCSMFVIKFMKVRPRRVPPRPLLQEADDLRHLHGLRLRVGLLHVHDR